MSGDHVTDVGKAGVRGGGGEALCRTTQSNNVFTHKPAFTPKKGDTSYNYDLTYTSL